MLPLDHVRLASLSSDLRHLDDGMGLVDYLLEHDATLTDVLLQYLGSPPAFTDGISQLGLAAWCRHTEPIYPGVMDDVRVFGSGRRIRLGTCRWESVQAVGPDPFFVGASVLEMSAGMVGQMLLEGQATVSTRELQGAIIRDLKRRVLALFPEVICRREVRLPWSLMRDFDGEWVNRSSGFTAGSSAFARPGWIIYPYGPELQSRGLLPHVALNLWIDQANSRFVFSQNFPIADTIPPEPAP